MPDVCHLRLSTINYFTNNKLCNYIYQEVLRERQENLRLVRLMQDKEEMIGKLQEEIDLLNRVSLYIFQFHGFLFSGNWIRIHKDERIIYCHC